METLIQIVRSLKPGEIRLVRNYYKIQSNGEERKALDLFDYIREAKTTSDVEACHAIYKQSLNSAFSHLKARLQRDILSMLLLQDSGKRYDEDYTKATFDTRRMVIEGQLLLGRGAYHAGVDILNKASTLATKYELYGEQISISEILRNHLGSRQGLKAYNKYDAQLKRAQLLHGYFLTAKEYHMRIMVPNLFELNKEKGFIEYAENALVELSAMYNNTGSNNIGFYHKYIGLFFYQMNGDYPKALEFALDFIALLESSSNIYSKSRMAEGYQQTGIIYLQLGKPHLAVDYFKMAIANFKKGLSNELQATEMLFFAHFRNKDFENAMATIQSATSHPKFNANKLIPAKWDYFKANLYFCMGKFDVAAELLIRYTALMRDRAGWLLGHKILEMMTMVEQGDIDIMDYRAESFRKLLLRQKEENINRVKAILKIFETFIKTGNNFKKTALLEQERLELLRAGEGDYNFDAIGFELVRFDEWFDQKTKK